MQQVIGSRAAQLDYMVALGTHPVMSDAEILRLYGLTPAQREADFASSRFMNHRWDRPETLVRIGRFEEREIADITGGLFAEAIDVTINRAIFDYDLILIVGPVFPHEIVGFLRRPQVPVPGHLRRRVPGLLSLAVRGHNLPQDHRAACHAGTGGSRTRRADGRRTASPGRHGGDLGRRALEGMYVGAPEEAWQRAVDHSERVHVVRKPRAYHTVFGRAPGDVRRDVGRRQGDVQAGAGGRRRAAR